MLHCGSTGGSSFGLDAYIPCCGRPRNSKILRIVADCQKVVGFLSAGLVFTSSVVNALVYSADGAKEAAAAGFILLSMVAVRSCDWV